MLAPWEYSLIIVLFTHHKAYCLAHWRSTVENTETYLQSQKRDLTLCSLYRSSFKYTDAKQLKYKGYKNIRHSNTNETGKIQVAIITKVDFRAKNVAIRKVNISW